MNECKQCGTHFDGNFCPQCGAKFQVNKTCPVCNAQVDNYAKFCNNCGYSFTADGNAGAAEQFAASAEAYEQPNGQNAPTVTRAYDPTRTYRIVAKVLPLVNKYAFLLFALLVWAFFAAPFGSLMGMLSVGNVYSSLNGLTDDFKPVAIASVVFGAVGFAYIAAVSASSFSYRVQNKRVGKFALTDILCVSSCAFYVVFFALGCAAVAKSNQIFVEGNAYSGVTIAFSLLFLLLHAGAFFGDILLGRKVVAYGQVRDGIDQARLQALEERKAYAVQTLADNGVTEPDKVERPLYKSELVRLGFINGSAAMGLMVCLIFCCIAVIITMVLLNYLPGQYHVSFLDIVCIGFAGFVAVLVIFLVAIFYVKSRLCNRNRNNIDKMLRRNNRATKVLFTVTVLEVCVTLAVAVLFNFVDGQAYRLLNALHWTLGSIAVPLFGVTAFLFLEYVYGKKIQTAFSLDGKHDPKYTVTTEDGEVPLTLDMLIEMQRNYDDYRLALRRYNRKFYSAMRGNYHAEAPEK
ncbi:MAG: zinc ribbon domain-containing protein [Corallococcus sp.]|nr:zinc ribbon domain-containing protein [Corallococcus sp.]MCM1359639.1 zinc ribbon domain-containing protein [Corallococcus sp.]MCM1395231.1 zinc ribbon domain-containing protein [Corallococcus sp.]